MKFNGNGDGNVKKVDVEVEDVEVKKERKNLSGTSPFFTIVIPVYNGEHFIRECLSSVSQQTFLDWECIVVNDGSTDSTAEIVKDITEKDGRIKLCQQPNAGVASALNLGISLAKAPWIVRLDADDLMLPNRLKCHYTIIENHDVDLLACSAVVVNAEGEEIGVNSCHVMTTEDALDLLSQGRVVGLLHPAVAYKKSIFETAGRYRPQMCPAEDIDLWCRMVEAGAKIVGSKEMVIKYRVHSASISRSKSKSVSLMVDYVEYCMKQRLANLDEPSLDSYQKSIEDAGIKVRMYYWRRGVNRYQMQQCAIAYATGEYARACGCMLIAIVVRPVKSIKKIVAKLKR